MTCCLLHKHLVYFSSLHISKGKTVHGLSDMKQQKGIKKRQTEKVKQQLPWLLLAPQKHRLVTPSMTMNLL